MSRAGAKKAPFYNIVAADSRRARDGKFLEKIGFFNPVARGAEERLRINLERIDYWVKNGAQLSVRVQTLIKDLKKSK